MQKPGEPVNVVVPDFVLKSLEAMPRVTDKHFFWSGKASSIASHAAGKRACAASFKSRRFQTVIRTDCATRSQWNCFSPACQLSV